MEKRLRRVTKEMLPQLRTFYEQLSFPPVLADIFFSRNADGNFVVVIDGQIAGHICMSYFYPFKLNIALGKCGSWGMHIPGFCVRFLRRIFVLSRYEVSNIVVLPDFRGKGCGDMLLSAGIEEARARGEKKLYLLVAKTNSIAIDFYEKKGFQVLAPWNEAKDIMCKDLA